MSISPPKITKLAEEIPMPASRAKRNAELAAQDAANTPAQSQNSPIDIDSVEPPTTQRTLPGQSATSVVVPKTSPAKNTGLSYSIAVKAMQQDILDFANAISSINLNSMKSQQEKPVDAFGNFLSEQYLDSTDPNALDNLAKQMRSIGTIGSKDPTDGVWGRNTHQALKDIIFVSRGMFSLAKDLNYPLPGYSEDQLNDLEKFIPTSYSDLKTPNERETKAKVIATHIKALTILFRGFKNGVANNPQLKSVIEKKKSFLNIPQSSQNAYEFLNEEDKKTYEQYKSVSLQPSDARLIDLRDMGNFKLYMQSHRMNSDNPEEITKALEQISSKLSAG